MPPKAWRACASVYPAWATSRISKRCPGNALRSGAGFARQQRVSDGYGRLETGVVGELEVTNAITRSIDTAGSRAQVGIYRNTRRAMLHAGGIQIHSGHVGTSANCHQHRVTHDVDSAGDGYAEIFID